MKYDELGIEGTLPGMMNPIETARTLKRRLADIIASRLTANWDRKHAVDTGGRIPLSAAGIKVSGDHARQGYDVVSTPTSVFAFISRFFPGRRSDYSYLDIGSGKGRTVLLASEMGFRICLGIEFASFACEIARRNVQSFIGSGVQRSPCLIVNDCATKFEFPAGNLVLFFNNPFSDEIWRQVVPRLVATGKEDRDVTVILIGSFPDKIRDAADELARSGAFATEAQGLTPRYWDAYAPFYFFVLRSAAHLA